MSHQLKKTKTEIFVEKCHRTRRSTHVAYDIQRTSAAQKAGAAILAARAHNAVITGNLMLITIMYSQEQRHIRYWAKTPILYNFNALTGIYGRFHVVRRKNHVSCCVCVEFWFVFASSDAVDCKVYGSKISAYVSTNWYFEAFRTFK